MIVYFTINIDWNIYLNGEVLRKVDFLNEIINDDLPTIIVLEEVTLDSYEVIKVTFDSFNIQYSLNFRPKGKHEGKNRELGICILYSNHFKHSESKVIGRLPFPERTLHTTLILENREINIVGFHSLTGCDYKKTKTAQFLSLADYIEENSIDFICFDASEPQVDYGDVYKNKYFKQLGNADIGARTFLKLWISKVLKIHIFQ